MYTENKTPVKLFIIHRNCHENFRKYEIGNRMEKGNLYDAQLTKYGRQPEQSTLSTDEAKKKELKGHNVTFQIEKIKCRGIKNFSNIFSFIM